MTTTSVRMRTLVVLLSLGLAALGASAQGRPAAAGTELPAAVQKAASRYPVTLYTTKGCAACDSARQWLQQHGVPFDEKTVNTPADARALRAYSGATDVPLLSIGQQQLRGFAVGDWQSYLDAAGYPRDARLPASWRPNVAPLAPESAAPAAVPTPPVVSPAPARPAEPDASDPTKPRIRF